MDIEPLKQAHEGFFAVSMGGPSPTAKVGERLAVLEGARAARFSIAKNTSESV